jgi:hypothetical protein
MGVHNETVVIRQRTGSTSDGDGVPVAAWTETTLKRCTVNPANSRTSLEPGEEDPSQNRWQLLTYEPQDWVGPGDEAVWRGRTYQIQSFPRTFWAVRPHSEILLTYTEG